MFIFEKSQAVVLCRGRYRLLECILSKEDGTYHSSNIFQMETELGEASSHSLGPNKIDVWQTGGISTSSWALQSITRIFKETPFSISSGPDLPMAMAGHCQLSLANGTIFIYGGVISINTSYNSLTHTLDKSFEYSDKAWTLPHINGKWTPVNVPMPCPKQKASKVLQLQQCSLKASSEIVLLHQYHEDDNICSSVFNLDTLLWTKVKATIMKSFPLDGFLIKGFDNSRIFYLSGLRIFEFIDGWTLLSSTTLPFHIDQTQFLMVRSELNVTQCKADAASWSTH